MSEIKGKRTEAESKLQEKIRRLERERDVALARLRELEQAPSNAEAELRTRATIDLLEGITQGTEDLIAAKDTSYRVMFRDTGMSLRTSGRRKRTSGVGVAEIVLFISSSFGTRNA